MLTDYEFTKTFLHTRKEEALQGNSQKSEKISLFVLLSAE
jgi:hypothetical protein